MKSCPVLIAPPFDLPPPASRLSLRRHALRLLVDAVPQGQALDEGRVLAEDEPAPQVPVRLLDLVPVLPRRAGDPRGEGLEVVLHRRVVEPSEDVGLLRER